MEGGEERKIALEAFCRLCAESVREGHRKTMRVLYCGEVISPRCPLVCRRGQVSLCCSVKGHSVDMKKVTEGDRRASLTLLKVSMCSKKQQA